MVNSTQSNSHATASVSSMRSFRMMRVLVKIAKKFDEAGVRLMVLKGAALNRTLYAKPDERSMADLDLMVCSQDVETAFALLEQLGGLKGEPLVRDDFFPRFHYETEYTIGKIYPVKIDLHVRPFRPLRYAQLVPEDAFWDRAVAVSIGDAQVLVPSEDDMLLHLAVHAAVHAYADRKWLIDIQRWVLARRDTINWERLLATVERWQLALPTHQAFQRVEHEWGSLFPAPVMRRLSKMRMNWRDRLALWHAPRDADHSTTHVAVNVACTPGWWFALTYFLAVLFPGKSHMADWYHRRHWGWLPCAHLLRCLGPVTKLFPKVAAWFATIETRKSPTHGVGVFAKKDFEVGEVVARYHGKPVERSGMYVVHHKDALGQKKKIELTGRLRFLNHSCRANAELRGYELLALKPIRGDQEIKINYGKAACQCRTKPLTERPAAVGSAADAPSTSRKRKRPTRRSRRLAKRKKVHAESDAVGAPPTRRHFLGDMSKKVAYITPILFTLTASPAFASGIASAFASGCAAIGEACNMDADCCNDNCPTMTTCEAIACGDPGDMCTVDADCCSVSCGAAMSGKCD